MRVFVLRFLSVLVLPLVASSGIAPRPALAAPSVSGWQVLGAARALPTLYRPAGLAVGSGGNIYVADSGNFRIVEIGPRGQVLAHFGEADLRPGPGAPAPANGGEATGASSLAVDSHGTVYVADALNRYIRVFSPQHHLVSDWTISVPHATILQMAVAIGGRGNIIVAIAAQVTCAARAGPSYCATYTIVQRRSPAGALLGQFHTPIGPSGMIMSPPVISQIDTAVDRQGNIHVATDGALACYKDCPSFHYLTEYAPNGKVLGRWGTTELDVTANWPALAIGGRGNIVLADDFNHRIEKRTAKGRVLGRYALGSLRPVLSAGPSGVAVDRAGAIYISDGGNNRVIKLSSSGKVLAAWGTGGTEPGRFWSPSAVALDAGGRLWVDDAGNGRIQMLGSDGRFHVQFAVPGAGPAMALDRAGNIYIGQSLHNVISVAKFSPAGKLLARWTNLYLAELPTGIAVAANGDVFVFGFVLFPSRDSRVLLSGDDILRLTPSGHEVWLAHVTYESCVCGIAVDAQENTYLAYGIAPNFEKFSPQGTLVTTWGTPGATFGFPNAAGITLDAAGNIYVANTPQNVIQKFDPGGTLLNTWGFHGSYPGQFHQPGSAAVAADGTLYVADTDNERIQKFTR